MPNSSDVDSSSDSNHDLVAALTFIGKHSASIKTLPGFRKGHSIPDRANISSQVFIAKLAEDALSEDLNTVFKALKTGFKFKRTQLLVTDSKDGTGSIVTPSFSYSISIDQDQTTPGDVIWRRSIENIKDSEAVFSDTFSDVFASVFDTLEFRTANAVDIESLVDSLEEIDDDRLNLEYDHELTGCLVTIEGVSAEIQVSPRSLCIVHSLPKSPSYLLRSFLAIQSALLGPGGASMIPIDDL